MINYNISFYLRTARGQEDGSAPLYARVRIDQEKYETSLGHNLHPSNWNNKKEQAIKCEHAALINSIISTFKTEIIKAITDLQLSKNEVTLENVRKLLKGEQISRTYKLIEVTVEHNQLFEKQVGTKFSHGSYKNYRTTLSFLKEFIKYQYNRNDIQLKEVNHKFCEHYFVWLTTEKTSKQNGAAKHLQRLKKIMNYAIRMGYLTTNPIQSYAISMKPVARVALTWEEITLIQGLKLQTDRLKCIRDIFIFQVFTGLPYADIKVFSNKHLIKGIDGKFWIKMERTKTHNPFAVPLLPAALEILQQYVKVDAPVDEPIFPVLSNQKMNYNLKIIQEIAGISKNLHTHLPRHTFASTITLLNGVPIETVSKMLGHSKIMATMTYARVGELKIAGDMQHLENKLTKTTQ